MEIHKSITALWKKNYRVVAELMLDKMCSDFIQINLFLSSFPSTEIAQVIASYTATGPEQLTLAPGQLILIRKKNPGGWWEGELQVSSFIFFFP